jgi:hypothetical protein
MAIITIFLAAFAALATSPTHAAESVKTCINNQEGGQTCAQVTQIGELMNGRQRYELTEVTSNGRPVERKYTSADSLCAEMGPTNFLFFGEYKGFRPLSILTPAMETEPVETIWNVMYSNGDCRPEKHTIHIVKKVGCVASDLLNR